MTIAEFLSDIQGYYRATYPAEQKAAIERYLLTLPPTILPHLAWEVKFIERFGEPLPIIEHYERAMPKAREIHSTIVSHRLANKAIALLEDREDCIPQDVVAETLRALYAKLAAKRYGGESNAAKPRLGIDR